MYCFNCGKNLPDNAVFCPYCGQKLDLKAENNGENYREGFSYKNEEASWHYVLNNVKFGPVSKMQISELISKNVINNATLVWQNGMSGWQKLEQTQLASLLGGNYTKEVNNLFIWLLATVPMVVNTVLWSLAGSLSSYSDYTAFSGLIVFVVFGLNILFWALDVSVIKKSTSAPTGWVWWILLLVPVYLFMRSAKVDREYSYSITWCVLFVVSSLVLTFL